MSAWRAIGGKCRALMAAVPKSSKTASPKKSAKAILKPLPLSRPLGDLIGVSEASRAEALKGIWDYVKKHDLQNPDNRREILCDEKLKEIFSGKDKIGMLEIPKLLSPHFKTN